MIKRRLGYVPKMSMLSSSETWLDCYGVAEKFFARDAHPFVIWLPLYICESGVFESLLDPLGIGVRDGWGERVQGGHGHVHRRCCCWSCCRRIRSSLYGHFLNSLLTVVNIRMGSLIPSLTLELMYSKIRRHAQYAISFSWWLVHQLYYGRWLALKAAIILLANLFLSGSTWNVCSTWRQIIYAHK